MKTTVLLEHRHFQAGVLPTPPRALAEAHPPIGADRSAVVRSEEEFLWQVFRRSYRQAPARQRGGGESPTARPSHPRLSRPLKASPAGWTWVSSAARRSHPRSHRGRV